MTTGTGPDPGALLGGPLGRAMLVQLAGLDPLMLLAAAGRPVPPGVAFLASELADSSPPPAPPPPPAPAPGDGDRGARSWPEWMNPGGDVTELIGSAVAEAVMLAPNERWFTDPLALLVPVANAADGWAFTEAFFDSEPLYAATVGQLRPLAETVATAPAARWWRTPVDRGHQRWLGCEHRGALARGDDVTRAVEAATNEEVAEEAEAAARARKRDAGRKRWLRNAGSEVIESGTWWSGPLPGTVWTSRGSIGDLPAVELGCVEDPFGEEDFEVWAVEIDPAARVYEVHGPADWARLVASHPREVTESRRADWSRWTGRTGTWLLPDWRSVAGEWDGVHVSVAGYLATAGTAVDVGDGEGEGDGAATLLAGWDADRTLWLRDEFTNVRRLGTWRGSPGTEAIEDALRR